MRGSNEQAAQQRHKEPGACSCTRLEPEDVIVVIGVPLAKDIGEALAANNVNCAPCRVVKQIIGVADGGQFGVGLEREAVQVCNLWRGAESADGDVTGNLSKSMEVG